MNDIPDNIEIELTDQDISDTTHNILEAMSSIRREAEIPDNISDVQKEEYRHLTFRLASNLQALADDTMFERMQQIADHINADERLLSYDPKQDRFWREKNADFDMDLEKTLFHIEGDRMTDFNGKHHVVQAIKYLAASDKDREKVLETILPLQNETVPFDIKAEEALHEVFEIREQDGSIIRARGPVRHLSRFVDTLQDYGFSELHLEIKNDQSFSAFNRNAKIKYIAPGTTTPDATGNKTLANIIKYTAPISLPILGSLPRPIRKAIQKKSSLHPYWMKFGQYASLGAIFVASMVYSKSAGLTNIYELFLYGGAVSTELTLRIQDVRTGQYRKEFAGFIPLEILLLPLSKHLDSNDPYDEHRVIAVDLEPRKIQKTTIQQDPLPVLEAIALENNISENYEQRKEDFFSYIGKKINSNGAVSFADANEDSHETVFLNAYPMDRYFKESILIGLKVENYLITTIAENFMSSSDIKEIIASDHSDLDKIAAIDNRHKPTYMRFRKYTAGELTADFEVFN